MNEQKLLAAITAAPMDDRPRLAYAQWCDYHDSPRGELIRVQCQLETLPETDPQRDALNARAHQLLNVHKDRWLTQITPLTFFTHFRRGFPEIAGVHVEKFALVADQLFALTPVTSLSLCCLDIKDYLPGIISSPHLSRVNKLSMSGLQIDDEKVELIAQSPHLQNLEILDLGDNKIKAKGVECLAQSKYLSNLKELSLYSNKIGSSGAKKLAQTTQLFQLKTLNLNSASIGAAGAAALANCEALSGLTRLIAGRFRFGNRDGGEAMGDDGMAALASSKYLRSLQQLLLDDSGIGSPGAMAIAKSHNLTSLVELKLSNNFINDAGGMALASASQLINLYSLDLTQNNLGPNGTKAFAQSPLLTHIKRLGLSGNGVYSDRTVEYTDWDGTVVGGGYDSMSLSEIKTAFGFPDGVYLF